MEWVKPKAEGDGSAELNLVDQNVHDRLCEKNMPTRLKREESRNKTQEDSDTIVRQ